MTLKKEVKSIFIMILEIKIGIVKKIFLWHNSLESVALLLPFKIYCYRYFLFLRLVNKLQKIGYGYTGPINANRIEKCPLPLVSKIKIKHLEVHNYMTDKNTGFTVTS